MKKLIIVICSITFLFCFINNKKIKIIGFYQNDLYKMNTLFYEKDAKAAYYEIYIYNDTKELIDIKRTQNNYYRLNFINKIQEKMYIQVISYNNKNRERRKSKKHLIIWKKPYLTIEDNKVFVLNSLADNYQIFINDGQEYKMLENSSDISNYDKKAIDLYEDNVLINKIYYIKDKENKVLYPNDKAIINDDDFYVNIKSNYNCIITFQNNIFDKCEALIKHELINEKKEYQIQIKYIYPDSYFPIEEDTITFYTQPRKLLPVVSSKASGEVLSNTLVELKSPNNATIFYTLDGSNPIDNGLKYEEPILISSDSIIKAIAKKNTEISSISSFEYEIKEKIPLVYLSPSRQIKNLGVKRAGYSNEKIEMNKLAVILEKKLKEKGIKVYRAEQAIDLSERVKESNKMGSDIYLALHSNASTNGYPKEGKARGIQSYISSPESSMVEFANIVQKKLMSIYKGPTNRSGVKYGTKTKMMFEIDEKNVKNGILLEIGFHDNYEDAYWIINNLDKIADAITEGITNYFKM